MQDIHRNERIPSILEARIRLNENALELQGTIRNISLTGACLWIPSTIELPAEFDLEIPYLKQTVHVRLVWSKERTHGVMFLGELHSPGGADPLAKLRKKYGSSSIPSATSKDLVPLVQDILDEAHQQITEILELPAEKVRIKLEVDP